MHYVKNWQIIIKNLYDDYPKLKIVYTGSSLLRLDYGSGDLSRRQVTYHLPGLSFREYLYFENIVDIKSVELTKLLTKHRELAEEITPDKAILKHFNDYLVRGYYPFYKEVFAGYEQRIMQITNQIWKATIRQWRKSTIQQCRR